MFLSLPLSTSVRTGRRVSSVRTRSELEHLTNSSRMPLKLAFLSMAAILRWTLWSSRRKGWRNSRRKDMRSLLWTPGGRGVVARGEGCGFAR